MTSVLRTLLLATALLSSGVLQVAAATGDDACCAGEAGEQDASCPGCPPGLACACYPVRGAVQATAHEVAPPASTGLALAVATAEPCLGPPVTDIFHPPRA